jgi:hypothetical protein
MHPTADTHDFMYLDSLRAAGDAWRYAADLILIVELWELGTKWKA